MRLKNEVTVGIFVLLGLAVLVLGALWLADTPFGEDQRELRAVFLEVGELRQGNPVKYRGVQVGRVASIGLASQGNGVLVEMEVRPDLELPPQAGVVLAPASLFGDWQANLISMSEMPDLAWTSAQGDNVLPGASLPDITELTAVGARIADDLQVLSDRVQLAFTEETALDIRRTIENVESMSETMTGFVEQQTETYSGVSQNVLQATQDIQEATETVTALATVVGSEVSAIVANARTASQNLEELSTRLEGATLGVPAMVARADTTLANFGRLATTADQVLQTLQPQAQEVGPMLIQARAAMTQLNGIMTRLETGDGTAARLVNDPALYEEVQRLISTMNRLMADVQANPGRYIGEVQIF